MCQGFLGIASRLDACLEGRSSIPGLSLLLAVAVPELSEGTSSETVPAVVAQQEACQEPLQLQHVPQRCLDLLKEGPAVSSSNQPSIDYSAYEGLA